MLKYFSLLILFLPEESYAYIDPGTGSYLFQILIAAVLSGLFFIKTFWLKIKLFFGRIIVRKK